MQLLESVLVTGLSLGLVYVLFAQGFSCTFSVLGEMNFAYGDSLVLSAFITLTASHHHIVFGALVIIALAAGALTGLAVNLIAMHPLRGRASSISFIVSGLGIALVLRNITLSEWGPASLPFPDVFAHGNWVMVGSQKLPVTTLVMLGTVALSIAFTYWLLRKTRVGFHIRAIAQDQFAARLVGVPVARTSYFVYAWGGAMGALAGILYASVYGVLGISLGFQATIVAWIAAVLGGKGVLWGPVAGGLLLGLTQSILAVYVSTLYETTFTYLIMMVILVITPEGLFAIRRTARV
jgi:branched-chain amino acid transport system permease protein